METYNRDFYGNITINSTMYTTPFLKSNLPYIFEYNNRTKEYFCISRTGQYLGYDASSLIYILPNVNIDEYTRIYLFNDVIPPWNTREYMELYIENFNLETALLTNVNLGNYINPFDFICFQQK